MQVRPVTLEDFRAVCGLLAELGRPAVGDGDAEACRSAFIADLGDPAADHRLALESGYSRTRAHGVYVAAGMTDGGKYFVKDLR